MNKVWLNPRSMLSQHELQEIYKYENISDNWFYPEMVLKIWNSTSPNIEIPEKVKSNYVLVGRPTPIFRAYNLEKYLETNCKIFFKREDALTSSSFKITSAIPQAHYGFLENKLLTVTETGAGQTGVAASLASLFYNLKSIIFMVNTSYQQKPLRRIMMEM